MDCIYHKVTQILWKWTLYNNKSNRDILNIIRCKLLEASFRKGITTPLIFTPDTNLFASACIYLSSFPNGVNSYEIEPRRVSAFAHASSDRRRAWPTPIHNKAKGGGGSFAKIGIRTSVSDQSIITPTHFQKKPNYVISYVRQKVRLID